MQIETLYSAEEVGARVDDIAAHLYRDYADSPLSIVCIAEGATRFVDALVERLLARNVRLEVHSVRVERTRGMDLGAIQVSAFDPAVLDDRDVLIADDVADQGVTLRAMIDLVGLAEPRSIRVAVLVNKLEHDREELPLHYVGFEVERGWVVGFGMDVDGHFRDLDEIGIVREH